jgi:hypothetical protein
LRFQTTSRKNDSCARADDVRALLIAGGLMSPFHYRRIQYGGITAPKTELLFRAVDWFAPSFMSALFPR